MQCSISSCCNKESEEQEFQKEDYEEYVQYVCLDNKGDYTIIKEYGPMNYTLILDTYTIDLPEFKVEYESKKDGLVQKIDAYKIAYACKILGAGREKKTDNIDYSVGIYLNKKSGEAVKKGEILYTIYSNDETKTRLAQKYCDEAFEINGNKIPHKNLIYKVIKAEEVEDV